MRLTKWKAGTLVLAGGAVVACASATIHVERRGSGAAERDFDFTPTQGIDGHYITLPGYPLANCFDVVQADGGQHDALRAQSCASSQALETFLGYWKGDTEASWLTEETSIRQDVPLVCALGLTADTRPVPLMSFLHFSDVQIREPGAKLGGHSLSAQLDPVIESFERSYAQELYSMFVYGAVVATANAEILEEKQLRDPQRPAPEFMVHTGDSVDAGLRSEFMTFRDWSDRLVVPWYSVIGNHDVLAFGNLQMKPNPHAKPRAGETPMEKTAREAIAKQCDRRDKDRAARIAAYRQKRYGAPSPEVTKDPVRSETATDLARCTGGDWDSRACTCTRISDLLREEVLVATAPNNLGEQPDPSTKTKLMMTAPAAIRRVCLDHEVEADAFVMDPNQMEGDACRSPSSAYIDAHCNRLLPNGKRTCLVHNQGAGYGTKRGIKDRAPSLDGPIESICGVPGDGVPSELHGYDIDPLERGFYCFRANGSDLPGGRRVWSIVLNTSSEVGAYGEVDDDQLAWLTAVLDKVAAKDLVLVFGHHPVYDIYDPEHRAELVEQLTSRPQVVAYFTGHTHWAATRVIHPPKENDSKYHHVWEVIAPSVIAFPQQARQVTIKTLGDRLGYFEILSFSPTGKGDSVAKIEAARAGAEKDVCNEPTGCDDGKPRLPSRAVTFARLFFRLPFEDDKTKHDRSILTTAPTAQCRELDRATEQQQRR